MFELRKYIEENEKWRQQKHVVEPKPKREFERRDGRLKLMSRSGWSEGSLMQGSEGSLIGWGDHSFTLIYVYNSGVRIRCMIEDWREL